MDWKKLLKNRNNRLMLVILIIGVIIIILSMMLEDNSNEKGQDDVNYIREEERLSEILSEINGAGRVSVMISYEDGYNDDGGIGRGFSTQEQYPKPRGVIVVADGANDSSVRNALKDATGAVMGVGYNRVQVFAR